ncbi:S1 family peptidase [Streptomyces hainanensis]|uniref:Trypsin-like serine protease n=1 Tax=Streptomyces hainanensis TaxID=402648 RepID=A0A4R4TIP6_9ACTN|nr:S1 family peptidase [Streptomyces hainanensis]TDC77547.1 trypsin-like serine protease [Streptomyces hainanensis]
MRRTSGLRLGLSALLLLGALSGTGAVAADRSAADENEGASEAIVEAMSRDFGLTEAQARERLRAETAAAGIEEDARQAAGASFGGAWFEADTGELVVAVTDRDLVGAVRATGAEAEVVRHSEAELTATLEAVDGLAERSGAPAGVASWRVDPRANGVVVSVVEGEAQDPAVAAFLADAGRQGPVTVEETADRAPETFAAGTVGGDPFYTGNVRCSIGFSVHGGFVTAGHCGRPGQAVYGWDRSLVGYIQGSSFPGNDHAWVSVGNGWWTVPVVLGWGTVSDALVRGSAEAPIGASICRSGSTTGWHCGVVRGKNETVNYSSGEVVYQLTRTSVCAEPGDSGGSYISGDQAQGVTSGGYGNCSSGGETWYQPLNEILSTYGLTLHTA